LRLGWRDGLDHLISRSPRQIFGKDFDQFVAAADGGAGRAVVTKWVAMLTMLPLPVWRLEEYTRISLIEI
jgi:hypothetical protein